MNELLTRARRSPSRALALLLAPFLVFVLAACGSATGTIKVESSTRASMDITVLLDKSLAEGFGGPGDPDTFCNPDNLDIGAGDSAITVSSKEVGDQIECTLKGTGDPSVADEPAVTEVDNGKNILLDFGDTGITEAQWSDLESQGPLLGLDVGKATVDITIEMPGKVLESSSGTISGNKVHITDAKDLMVNGVTVKSEKGGGLGGLVTVIAILAVLGLLLLVAIAALLFFLARRKKAKAVPPAGFDGPGSAGQAPQAGPSGDPFTQNAQTPGSVSGSFAGPAAGAAGMGVAGAAGSGSSAPQPPSAPQAPSAPQPPSDPQGYTPAPASYASTPGTDSGSPAPQFGQNPQPPAAGNDNPFHADPDEPGTKNTES